MGLQNGASRDAVQCTWKAAGIRTSYLSLSALSGGRCTRDTSPDLPQPMLKLEADQAVVFEGTEEGDTLTSSVRP